MEDFRLKIGVVSMNFLEAWSGVERSCAGICSGLVERGHDVTILARIPKAKPKDDKGTLTQLPSKVKLLKLDLWDNKSGLPREKEKIKEQAFDVAIGMFGNREWLWFPWLFAGSRVPLIGAERVPPDDQAANIGRIGQLYEYYGVLAGMDSVQVLLEPFADFYPDIIKKRVTAIGNPIQFDDDDLSCYTGYKRSPVILGVGRFADDHKCFSLLIRAFAALSADFPEWKLKLVGDGPDEDSYKLLAKQLGVEKRVVFTGKVADPSGHYAQSEIFCMPSRNEGFGRVLVEAAAFELPLVGLACCAASKTLIAPEGGTLAGEDTPESLAEALRPLMLMSPERRRDMGQKAKNFFAENYSPEIIYGAWDSLIGKTVKTARENGQTQLDRILSCAPPENAAGTGSEEVRTIQRLEGEVCALLVEFDDLQKKQIAAGVMEALMQKTPGGKKGR
jgi:glycosyltransferase involved in cell wall biosynthesis